MKKIDDELSIEGSIAIGKSLLRTMARVEGHSIERRVDQQIEQELSGGWNCPGIDREQGSRQENKRGRSKWIRPIRSLLIQIARKIAWKIDRGSHRNTVDDAEHRRIQHDVEEAEAEYEKQYGRRIGRR